MNEQKPTISVLMPVYNRQEMVAGAIRSIQDQTLRDWELIILDDASTDGTLEVCRAFEVKDPRIRVHHSSENSGCGSSRNKLLSLARGEFIAMQDSDDLSVPERLSIEVQYLQKHPDIGLVSGLAACIDDDGNVFDYYPEHLRKGKTYPEQRSEMVRSLFLRECQIATPASMFRRSILSQVKNPFGDFRLTDDFYFYLQIAHFTRLGGIPEVFIHMRRGRNHSHVWKDTSAGILEGRRCLTQIYKRYKDDSTSSVNRSIYRKAMSASMVREARFFGGYHGLPLLLKGLVYQPSNRHAWRSLLNFSVRGIKKLATGDLFMNGKNPG